jgi:CheY-like chemotaxis protein
MTQTKQILLAEDDDDDSMFFTSAVSEIDPGFKVIRSRDGVELMNQLKNDICPHILFLDINMPRKNGFQCLLEIRQSENYKQLPVIIFSTSGGNEIVDFMYTSGANAFVIKPNDFNLWKAIIQKVIAIDWTSRLPKSSIKDFVLSVK